MSIYTRLFNKRFSIHVILVILSLLAVAWLQVPRLADEFRVDEDFRYYYWMYKFQEPDLFPALPLPDNEYLIINFSWGEVPVRYYNPGFDFLFYLASFLVKPPVFSKLLPFVLMPMTVLYLFEFGQVVRNRQTGVILAITFLLINLASSSSVSIANGLQRSFAAPLIIIAIYYLYQKKYMWAAGVLLVSALIYAPIFALTVAVWGVFALGQLWQSRASGLGVFTGGILHLIVAVFLGAMMLSPVLLPRVSHLFAATESVDDQVSSESQTQDSELDEKPYQYIWESPTYKTGGAYPLFIIFPIVGRGGLVDLGEDLINLLVLLLFGGLIFLVLGRKAWHLPQVVWSVLWATLAMFILSWLTIWLVNSFLLYLPSRYTRIGLYLFLFLFVFLNVVGFFKEAPTLMQRSPKRVVGLVVVVELLIMGLIVWYPNQWAKIGMFNMKWLLALAGVAFAVLGFALVKEPPRATPHMSRLGQSTAGRMLAGGAVVLVFLAWAVYAPLLTEVSYLNPPPAERELITFLATLPQDTLIGGSPCALDSVELFARRDVLFTCEQPRGVLIEPAMLAYYADDWPTITDFCRENGVDYLVVDPNTYSDDFLAQRKLFFEPVNQIILAGIANQKEFVLAQVSDEVKLFQNEDYFVVACETLAKVN